MASDSSLDLALADLMARRPETVAEQTATDAAIAALLRAGARPPQAGAPAASQLPLSTEAAPVPSMSTKSPFYGMGLKDACFKRLTLVAHKDAQTAKEVWEALAASGFQSAHNDPVHAVQNALSKRAAKHGDVLLVGGGKWGLKSWYTDDELEEIKSSVGAMGGRDRAEHGERTKAGMIVARQRGVPIGKPLFMTPERMEEVKASVRAGMSVVDIAKRYGITTKAIYNYLDRATLRALREEGVKERESAPVPAPGGKWTMN